MDSPLLLHCTIEEATGRFSMGNARFSVSGNSPNATISFGPWNPDKERFDMADRMTGCSIRDLPGGVMVVTGVQRTAIRRGASPAEAQMTIRVTPGRTADVDVEIDEQ